MSLKITLEDIAKLRLSDDDYQYLESISINNEVALLDIWNYKIDIVWYYLKTFEDTDKKIYTFVGMYCPIDIIKTNEIVKGLIDAGADVNAKNHNDDTTLMWAIRHGYNEIAKIFIVAGADVDAEDNAGNTALKWATVYGHSGIAKLLEEHKK